MRISHRTQWVPVAMLCCALLLAPAIWNGFPLLQYDTGGYLARWYEGYLVPSRAVAYGLFLHFGSLGAFWPVVVTQAALSVWVIALVLRAHGFGKQPWILLSVTTALTVFSTLPWLTSILLTDIFAGLAVLGLYLLLLRPSALTRGERFAMFMLIAISAATHSATIALLVALILPAVLLSIVQPHRMPLQRVGYAALAVTLGAALVFMANFALTKRLTWTPGGFALSFGRMLQDGIVYKYLDEHCPDSKLSLCSYKDELPSDADVWFWGSPLFNKLGRFAGLGEEMETITINCMLAYPSLQLRAAGVATIRQLMAVHTGEGVVNKIWHTYGVIERYTPKVAPLMRSARQQRGQISFITINWLHYPVALISMALLPVIIFLAHREKIPDAGELAAMCTLALLANAFICGALSNPHDRYGARLIWIAALACIITFLRLASRLGVRGSVEKP